MRRAESLASIAAASPLAEMSARSAVTSAAIMSRRTAPNTVEKSPTPARDRDEEDVFTPGATLT